MYERKPSVAVNFTLGAISGCIAVSVSYPTDLIRRNLQIQVIFFV